MSERTSGGPSARRSAARQRIEVSLKSNLKNADRKSCKRMGLTYVPDMQLTLTEGDVKRMQKEHDILSKKLGLPLVYGKETPKAPESEEVVKAVKESNRKYIDFDRTK